MGNLLIATIFIVALNVLMWISSAAMLDINPAGSVCFNLNGSIIDNSVTQSGNYSIVNNEIIGQMPNSEGTTITPSSTSISFTDIFNNILNWFKSAPGLKYVYGVVAAPYNILKCMNLPTIFVVGIGTFWYLASFLILITYLWRGD